MALRTLMLPLRYRVDWKPYGDTRWSTCARFFDKRDALECARRMTLPVRRVMKGNRCIASYSGPYIPSSAAAGDRAKGEGTGAPEH